MKNWDTIYKKKGKVQKNVQSIVRESLKILRKNKVKKILDLGCGTGRHTIFLAEKGFLVYGIDISVSGLNYIRKVRSRLALKNIILKRANMACLPFRDGFFDAIICTAVLTHGRISILNKAFKEIYRTLKKNGFFVLQILSQKDFTAKTGREIEPGTRIGIDDWDSDVPHHFFRKKEILGCLNKFEILLFKETPKISERLNRRRWHYEMIARKNV